MRHQRGQKGFSLIEVIISIAFVALSATIILQLFLVASYQNERGRKSDMALAYAQTALEAFKHSQSPTDILHMTDALDVPWLESGDGYRGEARFDGGWQPLGDGAAADRTLHVVAQLQPVGAQEALPLLFSGGGGRQICALYRMSITVTMLRGEKEEKLVDFSTQKYFTYMEAAQ